jgi:hypothetical protein
VTPPTSMLKPHLQLLWALGLAALALVVAWVNGDPSWGLIVGGGVLVGYALGAALDLLPPRRRRK